MQYAQDVRQCFLIKFYVLFADEIFAQGLADYNLALVSTGWILNVKRRNMNLREGAGSITELS